MGTGTQQNPDAEVVPHLERNVGTIVEEHGFIRASDAWKNAALAAVGDAVSPK
jgi:hypothetical protein